MRLPSIQFLVLAGLCLAPCSAAAQEPEPAPEHQHMAMDAQPEKGWTWTADANVFYGYNYQQRKFADFWAWESQNWGMLSAQRDAGPGRLTVHGMLSLEPFTIAAAGSPEVFQTGESYQRSPLINLQHPHDLFMDLGANYRVRSRGIGYSLETDLVGSPALGPTAFMHRESARDNPEAPLTHHYMDSTHISAGVITGGIEAGAFTFEASTFRGEELDDDNRLNIETPKLDSWSGRVSWRQGPWSAQFSGGHLHKPEWFEPVDVVRFTASAGFDGMAKGRPLAVTAAWGENREYGYALDGYLVEWDWRLTGTSTFYGRGEAVLKEIFGLGLHPPGVPIEPLVLSHVDALTLGYVFDIPQIRRTRLGIGADISVYKTSEDLVEYYGSPHSYHVFLRWRPARSAMAHMH